METTVNLSHETLLRVIAMICATTVLVIGGLAYRADRADQRRTRVKVNCIVNGGTWFDGKCFMPLEPIYVYDR